MKVEGEILGKRKGTSRMEGVKRENGGKYVQNTLYTCMRLS
jgi:hypothetical protein